MPRGAAARVRLCLCQRLVGPPVGARRPRGAGVRGRITSPESWLVSFMLRRLRWNMKMFLFSPRHFPTKSSVYDVALYIIFVPFCKIARHDGDCNCAIVAPPMRPRPLTAPPRRRRPPAPCVGLLRGSEVRVCTVVGFPPGPLWVLNIFFEMKAISRWLAFLAPFSISFFLFILSDLGYLKSRKLVSYFLEETTDGRILSARHHLKLRCAIPAIPFDPIHYLRYL